ncbi:hypothetical protein M413DRAFT_444068 [Hebeloma cylindrosporum]|uniref:Uncharacterized protein n=1 Tax=Hebeloma cylindrosporum TaxID=76867 RepID=A0A0C2Y079_HEBCY|nr:hypothetical protein M413DRAFT_444068 [Hebeloma cylindrosporum h7]
MLPSNGGPSDNLDTDFSALWVSENNGSNFDDDGTDEYLTDFSARLSPEPLWHADDLLVERHYEMPANSEDGCFAIDNSPPLSIRRGWSPDTFASQEKSDYSCMGTTPSPDDPKFSEVQAALIAPSVLLTVFQIFLDLLNPDIFVNSPTSSCKIPEQSGDKHLNDMIVKTYNITWKLND